MKQNSRQPVPEGVTPGEIIKLYTQNPPVDVDGMARALGLRVIEADLGSNISGMIKCDPIMGGISQFSVVINSFDSYLRKRFTLAHEIAHFLLHRDKLSNEFKEDRMFRGPLSEQLEEEANRLTADILMPRRLIRDLLEQGISTPEGLAAKLQVSVPAMEVRLGIPRAANKGPGTASS
jgi:uncharacterized protein DUF955